MKCIAFCFLCVYITYSCMSNKNEATPIMDVPQIDAPINQPKINTPPPAGKAPRVIVIPYPVDQSGATLI